MTKFTNAQLTNKVNEIREMKVSELKKEIKLIKEATGTTAFKGYTSMVKSELQELLIEWCETTFTLEQLRESEEVRKAQEATASTLEAPEASNDITPQNIVNALKSELTGDKTKDSAVFNKFIAHIQGCIKQARYDKKRHKVSVWSAKLNIIQFMKASKCA